MIDVFQVDGTVYSASVTTMGLGLLQPTFPMARSFYTQQVKWSIASILLSQEC